MTDWPRLIAQYRHAYRRRAAAQAALAVALAAGLAFAGGRRLTPPWSFAVMAAAAAWAGWSAWTGWRRWRQASESVRRLDDALGLKQRLVTVQEFAETDPPPSLLPALLEDAESRVSAGHLALPPLFTRPMGAAAAVLLLLLLWQVGPAAVKLASRPHDQSLPQPDTSDTAQDQAPDPQSGAAGQQGAPQDGQGQSASQQPQPSQSGQGETASKPQPQDARQQRDASGRSEKQAESASAQAQGSAQQQAGQQQRAGGEAGGPSSAGTSSPPRAPAPALAKGGPGERGAPGSVAGAQQDAMKGEIQELLKELSGELEQIEMQLAKADAPRPAPGTGSEADLFGGREPLPEAGKTLVPINLETDDAKTKSPRAGGGVAEASGTIDKDAPKADAEAAALSEAPTREEAAAARQPIPPEYRGAFERLKPGDEDPR